MQGRPYSQTLTLFHPAASRTKKRSSDSLLGSSVLTFEKKGAPRAPFVSSSRLVIDPASCYSGLFDPRQPLGDVLPVVDVRLPVDGEAVGRGEPPP